MEKIGYHKDRFRKCSENINYPQEPLAFLTENSVHWNRSNWNQLKRKRYLFLRFLECYKLNCNDYFRAWSKRRSAISGVIVLVKDIDSKETHCVKYFSSYNWWFRYNPIILENWPQLWRIIFVPWVVDKYRTMGKYGKADGGSKFIFLRWAYIPYF